MTAFPDPLDYLNRLRRRWILTAINETGPRRRSLPWVAHAVFDAAAVGAAVIVLAVVAMLVAMVVAFVWYVATH